ncbi:kinase-like domain-containing protein [Epithele typhae]|uniref:kinase-like domain-containing protein n=1 Tax=Epithele typhae TaxID=378194 RepID=UPI0020081988|nr:kinase-like domain-containing protein [Epithele typhae]KAH9921526.1 kinase-like domain-containing protein [Epithele typhae]
MSRYPNVDYSVFEIRTDLELYWTNRYALFKSYGYVLRPRFKPDWVPSWKYDLSISPMDAEDHISWHVWVPGLMDARRISDRALVIFKKVKTESEEVKLATYLSSEPLRQDPNNHCVPILDVIVDEEDPAVSFLVMPYLRHINDPLFDTVGSILDCIGQLLRGLVFLHSHNIAHRDCAYKNLMFDATAMYTQGFHPVTLITLPDNVSRFAPYSQRSQVGATYYFTDFGISTRFAPDEQNRLVTGMDGLDQELPELSDDVPYDPFKADVFILGNMIRTRLHYKYRNVDMIEPLMASMIHPNPRRRPTAKQALERFEKIQKECSFLRRVWRAEIRTESVVARVVLDSRSLEIDLFLVFYSARIYILICMFGKEE